MENRKEQNTCDDKIRLVPVTPEYPHIDRLLDIRDEAFPPNERIDSRDISNYTEENGWFFLAIENQNEPVGFTLWHDCGENMLFGLYIAIAKEFQNKHYGAQTFDLLIDEYFKGKTLFGFTEAPLPDTENYQQRLARVRFYNRGRLFLYDKIVDAGSYGKYQFVCTDPSIPQERLLKKLREFLPPSILANLKI